MKCPKCQTENPEGVKFCGRCGTRIQQTLVCPQCSHSNPPDVLFCHECGCALAEPASELSAPPAPSPSVPAFFANGRYQVKKFLGEGGKKKVYLAHDSALDRDVAFALIKTEKLDESARTRIKREAQAMGKLGDHPNIVSIFDIGDHEGQPYIVIPFMAGGDVEGLIKKAPDHKLPLEKAIEITKCVCHGLKFAHVRGIIHRDIKPGNIWLNAEGVAQIGDFGLAVAVDMSRLTQAGTMVGTVSYMPPEQAMGGEVTARADLYSLGAMLYEMVTGRPPFVGDDSVAIIGQHINVPPVSPSWHRADLPPALETLIMQLLEKDPEKRPASAALVLQALESVGAGEVKESSAEKAAPAENPLYRRVFVGRDTELKQLQSAFDGAMSGQGALWMVLGEPGIGKTALCEQLSTYVTLRGGRTLVGHCYEEGSLSLPYLAFVEAMRSYVLDRDSEGLKQELGSGASDVARIVSEIREKLDVKPRAAENPDEERYRLMQGVMSFLTNAAAAKPMLIVLEDLHDADKGTLDMLTHVARHLTRTRLLVVGTYRDVEVDRSHPLSAALAELRRVSTFGRVLLRGLNADEVHRMLENIAGQGIPWSLAEAVHRQTEGNPLFVQEVVRFLVEEGSITRKEGRWGTTRDTPLEMNIPEGLRDVIGKRLSLLSTECNQLLSAASVIGREFALDTLKAVVGGGEERFIQALREAVQLSALEERSQVGLVRYRFTHAFFRQTLYEEMIAPQRLKLHQQVARSLEALYATRLEEHAAELAEHFSHSTDPADLTKAVSYGQMAAKRAVDVFAYGEAVRLLRQALQVQRVLDAGDKGKQCDLLLEQGRALSMAGEPRRALDVEIPEAFSLAESIEDTDRASLACTSAILALVYHGLLSFATPEATRWAERADQYAKPGTIGRAWADFGTGWAKIAIAMNQTETAYTLAAEGLRIFDRALDLTRRLGDTEAFWFMSYFRLVVSAPQHTEECWLLAEELARRPRTGVPVKALSMALLLLAETFLETGDRKRAEEIGAELRQLAERTGQANTVLVSMRWDAELAIMDGKFEDYRAIVHQVPRRGEELGIPGYASLVEYQIGPGHLFLGDTREIERLMGRLTVETWPLKSLYLAHLRRDVEARDILDKTVAARFGFGSASDEVRVIADVSFLQAAVLAGHKVAAQMLLEKYSNCRIKIVAGTGVACIARHLGAAAAMLGKHDEARRYYQEAVNVCTEMRFRPELAFTHLGLAELLLDHYPAEKKDALEHLDSAIKEFREMKMQPSLERALRRKEILKA